MNQLLDLALSAAGGMERWAQISKLSARVSLVGGLYAIKKQPQGMPDVHIRMDLKSPSMSITPFPDERSSGHFTPDRVWTSREAGAITQELKNPRASFAGATLMTPWEPLQLLYFNAYALWNYLSTPFLLNRADIDTSELKPHEEYGQIWRVLEATFPPYLPTHTRTQRFYFNEQGHLQRLDYQTDVAGGVATHYCFDHKQFDGITLPTLRRVVPRRETGPAMFGPTAVLLRVSDVVFS